MSAWLTYTDGAWEEAGTTGAFDLDLAYGNDENDFSLTLPVPLDVGALVYIDGTGFGGIVRRQAESSGNGSSTLSYEGEAWQGIIASRCLRPDAGQDWLRVSGEANAVLRSLAARTGLDGIFSVSAASSGIQVDWQFDRYEDAYSGIRKMLAASSAKLVVSKEPGSKPVLSAVPRASYVDEQDASRFGYSAAYEVPVNHLVCLGKGDLAERDVVDLYADAEGNVSQVQTIFGRDYRQEVYELSNAEHDELVSEGTKKLQGYQLTSTAELSLPDDQSFEVGDVVGIVTDGGKEITAEVTKVICKTDGKGGLTVANEVGEVTASAGRSASSGSSGGGASYTAGEGIDIVGGTISAEVTPSMHEAVVSTAKEALSTASGASAAAGGAQQAADAAQGTADGALAAAGAAQAAADAAQASTDANVASVAASSPLTASRSGQAVSLAHAASGVTAGAYGPTANAAPGFGDTVTVGARTSVNASGHVTGMSGRTVTIPDDVATQSADGLMAASDKAKLDGVEKGANNYSHPTGAGYNHVPAGGSSGQVLRWSASGTAAWGADKDTTYSPATASADGLMSAADKARVDAYPWADITGKPATYPPSDHDHDGRYYTEAEADALLDAKAGARYANGYWGLALPDGSDAAYLRSPQNGIIPYKGGGSGYLGTSSWPWLYLYAKSIYEGGTALSSKYAAKSHAHAYAGSSTAGGAATSAAKLATARKIAIAGAVSGSASFDGSGDVTITVTGDSEAAGFLAAHPAGSYFATSDGTDPGTLYGGTWEGAPSLGPYWWHRIT